MTKRITREKNNTELLEIESQTIKKRTAAWAKSAMKGPEPTLPTIKRFMRWSEAEGWVEL